MRVLMELLSGDLRTGAANDSLDLAALGRPLGLELVLCGRIDHTLDDEARRRGITTTRGHSRFLSKWTAPAYAYDVLQWLVRIHRLKPDIVHLDYFGWAPSLACAARLTGIPVVSRAGGPFHPANKANQWIDAYVANCEPHAAALLSSPLASKVVVTGSLFRLDRLKPPYERSKPIPVRREGRVRLLFLGQLVERKGVDVLVAALARMATDAESLLVGGNWDDRGYPEQIRALMTRLKLERRVHLENHRPDAPALLDDCDVFVLPSRSDARPRTIIEAMYLGKPVVATRVGGIPTLIEDGVTGLLVPPDDADALARALDRLAGDASLRETIGKAAQEWVRAEVQPERAARAHVKLYRRLADAQRGDGSATRGRDHQDRP
jgi:glycosyltransferase involved in cell wall biosynthesis